MTVRWSMELLDPLLTRFNLRGMVTFNEEALGEICRRHDVLHLRLFGSAVIRRILPYAALSLLLSCSPSEPEWVWNLPDLSGTWTMHGTADPTVPLDARCQFGPIIFTLGEDVSARQTEKRVFRGPRPASEMICVDLTEDEIAHSGLENSRRDFPAEPMVFEVRVTEIYRGLGVGLFFNVGDGSFDTLLLFPEDITTTTQTTLNGTLRFPNFIGGAWTAVRSASAGSPSAG